MSGLFDGKFLGDLTVSPAKIDTSTASAPAHVASRQFVYDQITLAVNRRGIKDPARLATTSNISLTGIQTIDSKAGNAGDRILVWKNNTLTENGLYVMSAGTWLRCSDMDENGEAIAGQLVVVQEGATYADKVFEITTDGPITIGTTALTFGPFGQNYFATPVTSNKNMQASATVNDGDLACATGLVSTPATSSYVSVFIGSNMAKIRIEYGNGVKAGVVGYFSGDGGTTPRAYNALQAGDKFYWNQSVAGFNLATTDYLSFDENV